MKKMRKIDKELFGNVRSSSCDGNIVKQLISAGANPDIRDESGKNPLYYVRDTDVARFLIKSGANLQNRDEYERTPLFSVAVPEVAELFLLAGANVNAADRNGETPRDGGKGIRRRDDSGRAGEPEKGNGARCKV